MPEPGLTEEEKVQIRHHMGYLDVAEAYTFTLGTPAAVETQFLIEGAMNKVKVSAHGRLRYILGVLEGIEAQMIGDQELMAVNRLGEIEVNQKEQEQLDARYNRWVASLGNLLGCPRNPYDQRLATGGVNVRVG